MNEATPVIVTAPPARRRSFMLLKRGVQAAFAVLLLPRWLTYQLGRCIAGSRAFLAASESIARVPGLRGVYLRQAFYRRTLASCGQDVYFGWMSVFSMTEARVGERVYVGRFCSIGFAELEDEVMLADGVQILSGGHEHGTAESQSMQSQRQTFVRTRIGQGAWIGAGAVVMADVGAGAIVGAGAVVNRPIPARTLAVGVPARVVKHLSNAADISLAAEPARA